MDKKLIGWLVGFLIKKLSPDLVKRMLDAGLDQVESFIVNSETKVDDMALPLITVIREALNIPDNDEVE